MRPGAIAAISITVLGLVAMVAAFLANASPYVTIDEALADGGREVHVVGKLVPGTYGRDAMANRAFFSITDESGLTLPVVLDGMPPSNLQQATEVVAVGSVEEGVLVADQVLTKCPSKYEADDRA